MRENVAENFQDKIEQLMDEAAVLDYGPTRTALLEEAVRLADVHGDLDYGFAVREEYIDACTFGGYPEKSLVAFSWCLAQHDRNPRRFAEESLLWKYKWIVGCVTGFPQITRAQIDDMFADMARRFQGAGAGQRAVAKLRCDVAMDMGDHDRAPEFEREWQRLPRDWLSDCQACEIDLHVEYCILQNRDEDALNEARLILRGMIRCAEVPHRTYARLLAPHFRLGQLDDAMKLHRRGYKMVANNHKFLKHIARHLLFMTQTDNLDRAARIFQKQLPRAFSTADLSLRFDFYCPSLFLLQRLGNRKTITLRLPKEAPLYREDGKYRMNDLMTWLDTELRALAHRFDERNGNVYFATRLGEIARYHEDIKPYPYEESE